MNESSADNQRRWSAIAKLATGSSLAIGLALVTTPLLTRLYAKESFGLLGVGAALTGLLIPLATGALEQAILAAKDDEKARTLLAAILSWSVILGGLLSLGAVTAAWFEVLPWHLAWFIPFSVTFSAWNISLGLQANRQASYNLLTTAKVAQAASATVVGLALGFSGAPLHGLLAANLAGTAASVITLLRFRPHNLARPDEIWGSIAADLSFVTWTLPATWINTLSMQMPLWALTAFHGQAAAGAWILAQRVVTTPAGLISASAGEVFRQRAAKLIQEKGECGALVRRQAWELFLAAAPACVLLVWQGPRLFAWAFGPGWETAGALAAASAAVLFCQVTISPLTTLLLLRRHQRRDFFLQVLMLTMGAGTFAAGGLGMSPVFMILTWALGMSFAYCLYLHLSLSLSTRSSS
jgi:O-antigen/teichoic acid export membrane protein